MHSRNFFALCGATALAVLIAGWAVSSRPSIETSDFEGTPVFPNLLSNLNDVKTVTVRHKDGTFNLKSTGDGWVFTERDNYPVQDAKLGELLVKMSRLEKVEPKTKLAERYDRLDLIAPEDKEDTRAKEVTLKDADGDVLARLLVGKRKFTLGTTEGGTYILLPEDPQAWLVTGELNPGARARDWLVREISDIKDDDIRRVTVLHPDGESISAFKETPDQSNYAVENVPNGMELRRDSIADDMGRVLSNLLHDDVKAGSDIEFPEDKTITAIFEGFAGFTVTVDLVEDGDQNWLRFRGMAPDSGGPAATPDGEVNAPKKDWQQVIADLNAQTEGWAYQLPGYEVAGIKKRMADLIREPDEGGV